MSQPAGPAAYAQSGYADLSQAGATQQFAPAPSGGAAGAPAGPGMKERLNALMQRRIVGVELQHTRRRWIFIMGLGALLLGFGLAVSLWAWMGDNRVFMSNGGKFAFSLFSLIILGSPAVVWFSIARPSDMSIGMSIGFSGLLSLWCLIMGAQTAALGLSSSDAVSAFSFMLWILLTTLAVFTFIWRNTLKEGVAQPDAAAAPYAPMASPVNVGTVPPPSSSTYVVQSTTVPQVVQSPYYAAPVAAPVVSTGVAAPVATPLGTPGAPQPTMAAPLRTSHGDENRV